MIARTMRRTMTAATLMMSASMVLAACGGTGTDTEDLAQAGADEGSENSGTPGVYQFDEARTAVYTDQEPFTSNDQPVTVKLSDELAAAMPDGRSIAVDHFTVDASALDGGLCRAEVSISFAEGGEEAILDSDYFDDDDMPADKIVSSITDSWIYHEDFVVDELPDDSIEPDDVYITSDHQKLSYVSECSDDPDAEYLLYLHFPYIDEVSNAFAAVKVAVSGGQSDGATTILLGDTEAAINVSEDKWEQPSHS